MVEVQRLSVENDRLKQQAVSASAAEMSMGMTGAVMQMQRQIVQTMDAMAEKIGGLSRQPRSTLMDVKGLGKPVQFNNNQEGWAKWSRSLENFVVGIFGDEFRVLIEHVAESETEMKRSEIEDLFGDGADELDRIEEVHYKNSQWYLALAALTEEESQDNATGA